MILSKDIKLLPGSKVEVVIRVSKTLFRKNTIHYCKIILPDLRFKALELEKFLLMLLRINILRV